ncbi:MAG: ATP-binding protein [Pseudomonadota bacterium]
MLRRYMPKSLYARTVLIVILPIFLIQSFVTYFFFERHWELVTANLSANVAGQIALLTREFQDAQTRAQQEIVFDRANADLAIAMRFEPQKALPQKDKLSVFNVYNSTFDRELSARLINPYWFNTSSWPAYVEVRVAVNDGYLVFLPLRERVFATTGPIFVLWMIGVTILIGWIAIVFLRNQVRSILRLAHAAEAFGRGRDVPDYRPTGATEVRRAGYAFMAMRERIKRHIGQRTDMLAGVSHDLRTPLTRLKLSLAMLPDSKDVAETRKDVDEMERMLDEYLAFVRNQSIEEETENVAMGPFLRQIAEQMHRAGRAVELGPVREMTADIRPAAVKRAVENLINNGARHAGHVWLSLKAVEGHLEIIIDDDGPGIPPDQYEEVFKPFTRLDEARNQNEGGVGLGLAMVRDIARGHGGSVSLSRAPQGGLRAVLRLPV